MNENMAVRPDDKAKLSDVITHTAEILDGVEGLVSDLGSKLYGYDMVPSPAEMGNCMEQVLVTNHDRLAEIRNKLEVIDRRL